MISEFSVSIHKKSWCEREPQKVFPLYQGKEVYRQPIRNSSLVRKAPLPPQTDVMMAICHNVDRAHRRGSKFSRNLFKEGEVETFQVY